MRISFLATSLRGAGRDKLRFLIGLGGLAIGFACFILIFLFVQQERNHDRWLPGAERLYRVDVAEQYPGRPPLLIARAPGPLVPLMSENVPMVEAATRAFVAEAQMDVQERPVSQQILVADPNFFDLVQLPVIAGARDTILTDLSSVALSRRTADRLFGAHAVIGETVTLYLPQPREFRVSGIFETLPSNSHMAFDLVIPHGAYFGAGAPDAIAGIPDTWGGAYFHSYVRLRPGASPADMEKQLANLVDTHLPADLARIVGVKPHEFLDFNLVHVRDAHLHGYSLAAMKPTGDPAALKLFGAAALLVLFIATINFSTMSAARLIGRRKELALRKVLGAERTGLAFMIVAETVLMVGIALLLSLIIASFSLRLQANWLGSPIKIGLWSDATLLFALPIAVTLSGIIAAAWPALKLSTVEPAEVLHAGRGTVGISAPVQKILLILQYGITVILLSCTIVFILQARFAVQTDLGFNPDNILLIEAPAQAASEDISLFADRLETEIQGVQTAALSTAVPAVSSSGSETNISLLVEGSEKPVPLGLYGVDFDFLAAYKVPPLAGRLFSQSFAGDRLTLHDDGSRTGAAVINRSALARLGFDRPESALGAVLRTSTIAFTIVGVIDDMQFRSVRHGVRDDVFYLPATPGPWISIRHDGGDVPALRRAISDQWHLAFPNHELELLRLTDAVTELHQAERAQARMLTAFTVLALAISSAGLFAAASFSLSQKAPEVAIRKVLGAEPQDIARLFIWQFLKPIAWAALLGMPIAWWITRLWLDGFAQRIGLTPLPFLLAIILAMAIAGITVGWHAFHATRISPKLALSAE